MDEKNIEILNDVTIHNFLRCNECNSFLKAIFVNNEIYLICPEVKLGDLEAIENLKHTFLKIEARATPSISIKWM